MTYNIIFLFFLLTISNANERREKLMMILIDGIRFNYEVNKLSGFQKVFQRGVTADYLKPVFPTISSTNYFSIFTGKEHIFHDQILFN